MEFAHRENSPQLHLEKGKWQGMFVCFFFFSIYYSWMHKYLVNNASWGIVKLLCNEYLGLWNSIIMGIHNEWLFGDKFAGIQLPYFFFDDLFLRLNLAGQQLREKKAEIGN